MLAFRQMAKVGAMLTLVGGLFAAGVATQGAILRDVELRKLGSSASSAGEHRKLAAHYRAHAAEHAADAATHDAIVTAARKRPTDDDAWDLARDAAHYAEHSREAAEALTELAVLHEEMAKR